MRKQQLEASNSKAGNFLQAHNDKKLSEAVCQVAMDKETASPYKQSVRELSRTRLTQLVEEARAQRDYISQQEQSYATEPATMDGFADQFKALLKQVRAVRGIDERR